MAYDQVKTEYDVQPIENPDGTLGGLKIQQTRRLLRVRDDGAVLNFGRSEDVGSALEIPWGKVEELVRELVSWPLYYASGQAARDRAKPVSWPNSVSIDPTGATR